MAAADRSSEPRPPAASGCRDGSDASLRVLAAGRDRIAAACLPPPAQAAEASGIRDSRDRAATSAPWPRPVWRAAGLEPRDVGIYLVNDNQLNSFVAGGQAIFINTGLILKAENANQLIGVLAHETGHIAGGHILRAKEAMKNASIETIIAMVVAAAAARGRAAAARRCSARWGSASVRSCGSRSRRKRRPTTPRSIMLDRACQSARGLLQVFRDPAERAKCCPATGRTRGAAPIR